MTDCVPENLAFWETQQSLFTCVRFTIIDIRTRPRRRNPPDTLVMSFPGDLCGRILSLCHQCTASSPFQIRQDGRIYMASCATRVIDPLVEEEDDSVDGDSDGKWPRGIIKPRDNPRAGP